MGNSKIFRRILILLLTSPGLYSVAAFPEKHTPDVVLLTTDTTTSPNYRKLHGIFAAQSAVYVGSLYLLSKSWYKNPLSNFHFRDDPHVWLQMDKLGHLYTAFQISQYTSELYRPTGISTKQRILYGALSGFIFQTPIELLDGFSPEYGFSASDIAANLAGSALFASQMLAWNELKIMPKFSARLTPYAAVRPELLGNNRAERLLKDYNGQTFWLSASPKSFLPALNWPRWLCFSAGYGIENMVAAEIGKSTAMGYVPYRQYYFSMDVDLSKLPIKNRLLRHLSFFLNTIKIPAPTLVFGGQRPLRFHPFYF